jgi:integrase
MSAPALRRVTGLAVVAPAIGDGAWLEWLVGHIDPDWRAAEWDPSLWLFTGDLTNTRTAAWPCRTKGCPTPAHRLDGRCYTCGRERAASDLSDEEFDIQPRRRLDRPMSSDPCAVPGCEGDYSCRGLCHRHERSWRHTNMSVADFIARALPLRRWQLCAVAGCGRERISSPRRLCAFHNNRFQHAQRLSGITLPPHALARFIEGERPRTVSHQFSMAGLSVLVRHELLYALQQRDKMPPPLDPRQIWRITRRLEGVESLRLADAEAICESGGIQYNSIIRGMFRDLQRHLQRAWVAHTGTDPYAGDVWEVRLLDLQLNGSRRWAARLGVVDFAAIRLPWLREVAKDWARTAHPYLQKLREVLMACRAASSVLVAAGHEGPATLGACEFASVVQAISAERRADGMLYSAAHRNLLLCRLHEVIEHGRLSGLMAEVPGTFGRGKAHRIARETNEDEIGKALPDVVISQLDANISLLGPAGRCGSTSSADLKAMHQAIYRLLRDTGRRPGEIVSLRVGCIEMIDDQPNLVYDNHKAGRMRRRLPITTETAEHVISWERHRVVIPGPPVTSEWLFPTSLLRAHQSIGHVTPSCFTRIFKEWVRGFEAISGDVLGPDGYPLPFDRRLIFPYALRHSYAQRHADAGVPVDVLRDLMDHVSIQTTMGYYRVSLKRKQEAIRSVGSFATDSAGNQSPFTSPLAWEKASVSVPFGNCTEPSNVRAGGSSCPIRFQCAGCGFYRPDPSYLAAIEEHVAGLRADRETALAIGAAGYVIANLVSQMEAFNRIVDSIKERLAALGADERAEVEEASRLLRRARAARVIPVRASR